MSERRLTTGWSGRCRIRCKVLLLVASLVAGTAPAPRCVPPPSLGVRGRDFTPGSLGVGFGHGSFERRHISHGIDSPGV
jgi:hypothetical protein